jgi:hypothetical protein
MSMEENMPLTESDLQRAAEAVRHQRGPDAATYVRRYAMLLRMDAHGELAEHWERIADLIESLEPRSVH